MNKRSKQRDAISSVLKSTDTHPSAEWLYEQVKKTIPDIGLATVYRNLRILKEAGEVAEMHIFDDRARFDGNTARHYHFYCDRCRKVLDLDEPIDTSIEARIEEKTGLKITHHHLEFSGLCLDCQKLEIHTEHHISQ